MSNRKRPAATPQELLTLMDSYLTALYHQRHDPERPPELADRICRHIRPADLGKLV
jgi:cobalamin biosynthesis Mg chelatase CobN